MIVALMLCGCRTIKESNLVAKAQFKELTGSKGALLLGSPEQVSEKIEHHSNALCGISRITFQMDNAALPNEKLMESIALIGRSVKPNLR